MEVHDQLLNAINCNCKRSAPKPNLGNQEVWSTLNTFWGLMKVIIWESRSRQAIAEDRGGRKDWETKPPVINGVRKRTPSYRLVRPTLRARRRPGVNQLVWKHPPVLSEKHRESSVNLAHAFKPLVLVCETPAPKERRDKQRTCCFLCSFSQDLSCWVRLNSHLNVTSTLH